MERLLEAKGQIKEEMKTRLDQPRAKSRAAESLPQARPAGPAAALGSGP